MEIISAKDNRTIKKVLALKQRKYREKYEAYAVEGLRGVSDLIETGSLQQVLIRESLLPRPGIAELLQACEAVHIPTAAAADGVFSRLEDTVNGQGIIGIAGKASPVFSEFTADRDLYLLLDTIQDPGNLGTIIRTASAAGAGALFLTKGSADPYNSKTVRSTMSALTSIPIYEGLSPEEVKTLLTDKGLHPWVTTLSDAVPYDSAAYTGPVLLIFGNEGSGVSPDIQALCPNHIHIPMYGPVESLNLAVAAGIALYKVREQLERNRSGLDR